MITLNGKWSCQISDGKEHNYTLDGNVPGCVHTDLIKVGIIEDIFWRTNADDVPYMLSANGFFLKKGEKITVSVLKDRNF